MKQAFQEKVADILSRCNDMTIATLRPDGSPQATVVSFVHDGLLIYFGCGADSQKARNIARDRRVSITVTPPYGSWSEISGLSISGAASAVTSPREKALVARLMVERFPQVAGFEERDEAAIRLFRVRPSLISVLDYTKGFGHTELVAVGPDDITESRGITRHHWAGMEQAA